MLYKICIRAMQFVNPLDLSGRRGMSAKTSKVARFHATNAWSYTNIYTGSNPNAQTITGVSCLALFTILHIATSSRFIWLCFWLSNTVCRNRVRNASGIWQGNLPMKTMFSIAKFRASRR
jgi:hypothetical protein